MKAWREIIEAPNAELSRAQTAYGVNAEWYRVGLNDGLDGLPLDP